MQATHEFQLKAETLTAIIDNPNASAEAKREAANAMHALEQKYGLTAKGVGLKLYADSNDTYSKGGNEYFRNASYYDQDNVIGVNLSDANGRIIDGEEYARRKAHENYESLYHDHNNAEIMGGIAQVGIAIL